MGSKVFSYFDRTGVMVEPWAAAGAECHIFDLQHEPGTVRHGKGSITTHRWDALDPHCTVEQGVVFASFFPPCTHLSVSGARWMQGKGLRALARSIEMFAAATEIAEKLGCPYVIENPVSTISTYWRPPDFTFDPCDYGDPYTKRTCLWLGGGAKAPPIIRAGDMFDEPTAVEPTEGSMMHQLPPSEDRADIRSATPRGFAQAMYLANRGIA